MLIRTLLVATTFFFSSLASAQFHNILTHPDPAAYTSVSESGDYDGERLIASTVPTISGPIVRIARVKNSGEVSWEQDYFYISGLRAKHIIPIDSVSAVLIALRDPSTAVGGATPARTVLMRFNVNTGAVLATSEIQEFSPVGGEKGLVALHGIYSNQSLILTGWFGGGTGVYLQEDRYAVVASVSVPQVNSNNPVTVNWINGLNSPYSNLDYGDHDMGAHIVEVPNSGYFISGSANYIFTNAQGLAEHHQSALSALVSYTGAITWAKSVALEPVLSTDPRVERHIVGSSAAAIITTDNPNNTFEIAQTCNWTGNKGLAILRYDLSGNIIFSPLALRINGAYTYSSSETSLKGYTTYRFAGDDNANTIALAGYANNPEYLNSNQAAGPKDRIPFLLRLDITATTGASFIQDQHFYSGNPSTDYGDDPGIFAANSRDGQQPIIFHPEMMDLAETTTGGFNIIGHRRTHEYLGPDDFDPDVILTDAMGFDLGSTGSDCPEFQMPLSLELPGYNVISLESVLVSVASNLTSIESISIEQDVVPCEDYFPCDVLLEVNVHTDTCDLFTLTAINLGSTPMSQLQLSFDHGNDGTTEQSGTADGSDGSGNPSYSAFYPTGATDVKVTLTCQGVDYVHIETINRDCPDDNECVLTNDLEAVLIVNDNPSLCTTDVLIEGSVTPVDGATISWTLGGNPMPAADGQWSHIFEETVPGVLEGNYVDFICATVTCPDGTSLTECADISIISVLGSLGLDMWLYCGAGCYFGATGTQAAVTINPDLWSMDPAIYGAEVNFSDGTTFPLNLDHPLSIIKCFSAFSFFKTACLRVYELEDTSCYVEFCDSETCISIAPIDPDAVLVHLLPDLSIEQESCSIIVPDFLENLGYTEVEWTYQSETQLQLIDLGDVESEGWVSGDDLIIGFLSGEDLSADAVDPASLGYGDQAGSYASNGDGAFIANVSTPVILVEVDSVGTPNIDLSNLTGNELVLTTYELEIQAGIVVGTPGDTYTPGETYTPGDAYLTGGSDLVSTNSAFLPWHRGYILDCDVPMDEGYTEVEWTDNSALSPSLQYDENGLLTSWVGFSPGPIGLVNLDVGPVNAECPSEAIYVATAKIGGVFAGEITDDFWGTSDLEAMPVIFETLITTACENVNMTVLTDNYPSETTWEVSDANGNVVWSGGPYLDSQTELTESTCLSPGCFTLSFYDSYGDGICCDFGMGEYTLSLDSEATILASGGTFGAVDIKDFCIGFPSASIATVDTTCDAVFTHETMALGLLPGSTPGTYIHTEDNIQLGFEAFWDGSSWIYGNAAISTAVTGAGSGQVLTTSNILAVYDLSAFSNVIDVSFEFFDGAGIENLIINGGTLHTGELENMPTAIAPGVTMAVSYTNHPGYQVGLVELTGNVQKIEVGGQQFYVDHVCVHHDGETPPNQGNTSECPSICDAGTDFDSLTMGKKYGDLLNGATIAVAPGGHAVDSDGIPIYLEPLFDAMGGAGFNYAEVDGSPGYGFGTNQTMRAQNITIEFDIQAAKPITDTVCIEFIDFGGYENFSINGVTPLISPNGKGGLTAFHGASIGGVAVSVTGFSHVISSTGVVVAFQGEIIMIGDVDEFSIGGQELWVDNLCISNGDDSIPNENTSNYCPDSCEYEVTFDLHGLNTQWGDVAPGPSSYPLPAGGFMFNEAGIDLYTDSLFSLHYPNGYYKNQITTSPVTGFGNGYVMHTNNATVEFDLAALNADTICLHMLDLGGYEYLEVNGQPFSSFNDYGGLMNAPSALGGVNVQVSGFPIETMVGGALDTTGYQMQLHLYGNVQTLKVGGQEFWIDNMCISTSSELPTSSTVITTIPEGDLVNLITPTLGSVANDSCAFVLLANDWAQGLNSMTSDNVQVNYMLISSTTGDTLLTASDISSLTVNGLTDDTWLVVSIISLDLNLIWEFDLPEIIIPGCPIDDFPCSTFADFAWVDMGNCGQGILMFTGNAAGGFLTWTIEGSMTGESTSFFHDFGGEGDYLVCVTVQDFERPECTDTHCEYIHISCPNEYEPDSCAYGFGHESMALGLVAIPAAGVVVATEDDIDLSFEDFHLSGTTMFGNAAVDMAVTGAGWNHVLNAGNILAVYDISNYVGVSGVSFDYFDGDGVENLRINGALYEGQLNAAPATLGGVSITVFETAYTGYRAGRVELTGNVTELGIGGQQFYVDDICVTAEGVDCLDTDQDNVCDNDEQPGCTDPDSPNYDPNATDDDGSCTPGEWDDQTENATCPDECDHVVDFESQALGAFWEDPATPVGVYMFTENGIDIFSDGLNSTLYGAFYNRNEIMLSPRPGFGSNHVMMTNNAGITLELDDLPTDTVCFEFLDMGGFETLEINGANFSSVNGYGGLQGAPITLGGVGVKVTGTPIVQLTSSGAQQIGFQGKIELYGDVDKLIIAGQELWVDNFCLSDGVEVAAGCTYPDADNYNPVANEEDGSCTFPVQSCEGDLDGDGTIVVSDLLMLLSVFATDCE